MDEDRAKVTINCLYKVIHITQVSIGAKMYDFEVVTSEGDLRFFCGRSS